MPNESDFKARDVFFRNRNIACANIVLLQLVQLTLPVSSLFERRYNLIKLAVNVPSSKQLKRNMIIEKEKMNMFTEKLHSVRLPCPLHMWLK